MGLGVVGLGVVGLGVVGLGVVGLGVVVVMDSNYTKNEISRFGILHLPIKYRKIFLKLNNALKFTYYLSCKYC